MKVYTMTTEGRQELRSTVADFVRALLGTDEFAGPVADIAEMLVVGFSETRWHDPDELTSVVLRQLQSETRLLQRRANIRRLAREIRAALPHDASPELKVAIEQLAT